MPNRISFKTILILGLVTLGISIARLVLELNGQANVAGGGGGYPLGITWLPPLLGLGFGWVLAGRGHRPVRLGKVALTVVIALLAAMGAAFFAVSKVTAKEIELTTFTAIMVSSFAVAAIFVIRAWPAVGLALLTYGLLARIGVVAITWLCLTKGWDTHYTKFGPDDSPTIPDSDTQAMMITVAFQLGFWTAFTIITGTLTATLAAAVRKRA